MDGQQRLHAGIVAGRPFTSAVVHGVESLDDVDRSKSRTLGHALGMHGYPSSIKLATVLSTVWRWEHTNWRSNTIRPTVREATRYLERHYTMIYDAFRQATKITHIEGSAENAGLAYWRLARTCGTDVGTAIFSRLAKSEWQDVDDPLWRYYELAIKAKAASRKADKKVRLCWLIGAINSSLNGERYKNAHFLRWDASKKLRILTGEELPTRIQDDQWDRDGNLATKD